MSSSVNRHNSDDVHRLNDINRWLEINYLDLLFKSPANGVCPLCTQMEVKSSF